MARGKRGISKGIPVTYHVMSHTALDGFPIGESEKKYLHDLVEHYSSIYFCEIIGLTIMGNHFHMIVRMQPEKKYINAEVEDRFKRCYGEDAQITPEQIGKFRRRWEDLSKFVGEIKQRFSLYYNKKHGRKGFFWRERYKSVIVENGWTLVHCLAYVDLNPVRAGLVERPEDYPWCSLGYHMQTGNAGNFLSTDFGLAEWDVPEVDRLQAYRKYLYETGALESPKGARISDDIMDKERKRDFKISMGAQLMQKCNSLTNGGVIGSSEFVQEMGRRLQIGTSTAHSPRPVDGFDGMFSMKRQSNK